MSSPRGRSRQRRCIHSQLFGMAPDVHLEHVGAPLRELAHRVGMIGGRRLDRVLVDHPIAAAGSGTANTGTIGAPVRSASAATRRRGRCRPVEEVDEHRLAVWMC